MAGECSRWREAADEVVGNDLVEPHRAAEIFQPMLP
jgi:hypothetical protein